MLFRLYKSLGEYDILRGIFSNLEGTKDTTRQALEAEERGDYIDALRMYKEVGFFNVHVFSCPCHACLPFLHLFIFKVLICLVWGLLVLGHASGTVA